MTASANLVEFEQSGHPTAVYDAKYKPWGQTPSTGDLYQVVTCAHRLGVNRVFPSARGAVNIARSSSAAG